MKKPDSTDWLWLFVSGWVSGWLRYLVALTSTLATVAIIAFAPRIIDNRTFIAPLVLMVCISAAVCGLGPALAVIVVGALATAYFLPPAETLQIETAHDFVLFTSFVLFSCFAALVGARRLRSRPR